MMRILRNNSISSIFVFLLFVQTTNGIVFQGTCSDKDVFCEQLCLTISPETYECGCWNDHTLLDDGLSCRVNATRSTAVDRPTHRVTESTTVTTVRAEKVEDEILDLRPPEDREPPLRFTGQNFAEFPLVDSFYLESNVTLEFKINERHDGILLFAGEFEGDDFFSLALQGPNIIFRYDCGEGPIEDLYRGPFHSGEWHTLTVRRKYCERAEMRVDDGSQMVDETGQFKYYKGISVDGGIYVGGAPHNVDFLDARTGSAIGVDACVRKLEVNGNILLDSSKGINKAVNRVKFDYCNDVVVSSTTETIFETTTASLVSSEDEDVKEVILQTGPIELKEPTASTGRFFGHNMPGYVHRKVISVAKPTHLKKFPVTPHPEATSSHSTTSSILTTESPAVNRSVKIVEFSGRSHVSVPAPDDVGEYLEVVLHFKPTLNQGVLFYWYQGPRFFVLALESGFLSAHVSMGADTVTVRSENVVSLHTWHKAEVWRSGKGILLKVDRQSWIEAELHSFGRSIGVSSTPSRDLSDGAANGMSIGGADWQLPPHVMHLEGFHGCMKKVVLNGRHVHLSAHPSVEIRECGSDPCASAGCPSGCASRHDTFVCMCQWPTYGRTCGMRSVNAPEAMHFNGHSYLEFTSDEYMQHITGDQLRFVIEFKLSNETNIYGASEQILAFAGSDETSADFIRLSVTRDRTVRFTANLGSGEAELIHPTVVPLERWTTVQVFREGRTLRMSIDGMSPVTTATPGASEQLNVYKSFFIGGYESEVFHAEGLMGCVRMAQLGARVIRQPSDATTAINIRECAL